MSEPEINTISNPSIKGREGDFTTVKVDLSAVLDSWKISLFSFEWLTPEGSIREVSDLPEAERVKYESVSHQIDVGESVECPVLGIGVMDNVEIGSRRDVLLTAYSKGVRVMDAHVKTANLDDFKSYIVKE